MESTSSTTVVTFPRPLTELTRTNIARPTKSRSKADKNDEEEILVIDIEVQRSNEYVKFDVYINDEDDVPSKATQMKSEYAGSFVHVPRRRHGHHDGDDHNLSTCLKLGLTDLIEDLGADDDDGVTVTLVPKSGVDNVVINNVKIEFAS